MIVSIEQLESVLINPALTGNGKNFKADCPHCGHREFFVSIEKENHPANCYRKKNCGFTANIFTLAKMAGIYDQIIEHGKIIYSTYKLTKELFVKPIKSQYVEIEEINLPIGYKRMMTPNEYLLTRGFTDEDCENYEVGTSKLSAKLAGKYVIFPVYMFGKLVSYVSRLQIKSEFQPKYSNSETKFESIFYGLEEKKSPKIVVLVEGIFDKIGVDKALKHYGLFSDDILVLSTFGASLTDMQQLLLMRLNPEEIIILYDSDVFQISYKTMLSISYVFPKVGVSLISQTGKKKIDPGNASPELIIDSLDSPLRLNQMRDKIGPNYLKKHTLHH